MRFGCRTTALILLTVSLSLSAHAQSSMDNAAVLKLQKAGLGDDLMVSTINGQPGHYSLTTDDLIALKKAGLSDKVVAAMLAKNMAPATAAAPAATPDKPLVDEVGVYYMDKTGKWQPILPEIVNFKTGGVLKSFATGGIVKGDMNGHINGLTSKLDVFDPVKILIYTSEGTAPTEYQLLKLHPSGDGREFRSVTGGVVHASTGATRDQIEFTPTKIAPRTYEIDLGPTVGKGQFGMLPPNGTASSNAASAGKLYTFHIVE